MVAAVRTVPSVSDFVQTIPRESAPPSPARAARSRPPPEDPQEPEQPVPGETYGDRMAREALRLGGPVDVDPSEPPVTGPAADELARTAEAAHRIEEEDAPANLRRIAMGCQLEGEKMEGHLFVVATLNSGGGRVRVENLVIKDSTLPDPAMLDCVRTRLARASWDQPDAPDRRWRVTIPLSLPK